MIQYMELMFMVTVIIAQAPLPVPDWTHMVSPYFAFAAAAFLIWSLVQLVNLVYRHATSATDATIVTLRERLHSVEDKLTDVLFSTVEKNTEAVVHNSDALAKIDSSLNGLAVQMERFGDGLSRLEHSMEVHDSNVVENIARASQLSAERLRCNFNNSEPHGGGGTKNG